MKPACECCGGTRGLLPEPRANRPGLSALSYRAGSYATFLESMLARLTSLSLPGGEAGAELRPLAGLTTREPDDPALALLDAWAVVADVLTFYQERIVNEGYLATALERRSIVQLAKLIGYRARPGVAASVYLAFDAALGFNGVIPAGTRAQSIPGTGEVAEFFETSEDLPARYAWNLLTPRVTRPQLITPPAKAVTGARLADVVTGANQVDAVYFKGTALNLKVGEQLLFLFGSEPQQQFLRQIEAVKPQASDDRTEVVLAPPPPSVPTSAEELLSTFIDKASHLFPESELAQDVAVELSELIVNVHVVDTNQQAASLLRGAISRVREVGDIATRRNFSRLSAWLEHLQLTLERLARLCAAGALTDRPSEGPQVMGQVIFRPSTLHASPLGKLASIVDELAKPASLQPANAKQLSRSVSQSFSAQADTAPRLLGALKPRAAGQLYAAWPQLEAPSSRVELHALRVRASLFAHNFAGRPTVVTGGSTTFAEPTLSSAWRLAAGANQPPPYVALDAVYDQIKPGSWIAIERPAVDPGQGNGVSAGVTYHRVVAVRAATLDAGDNSGFSAKSSLLTVDPPWLSDLSPFDQLRLALNDTSFLRGTVVHAQSEAVPLAEEPLDTDVHADTIELNGVYEGLEPGRWIIVSGQRTDIPNLVGVTQSELSMIAGVAQGARPPLSVPFPLATPPFAEIYYTTNANAFGDRLVVGRLASLSVLQVQALAGAALSGSPALPLPSVPNQQYRDQVELGPAFYANAYLPTLQERVGNFADFAGLLVDPESGQPFEGGDISKAIQKQQLFAWRITSQAPHTVLTLASPLAYRYDARTLKIYGNVVRATHGQSVGEVLGDGAASQPFSRFPLRQAPLTYVSAPTPAGVESSLRVRVNELEWHERDNLPALGPRDRGFITQANDDDVVSVVFGNGEHGLTLPTGKGNVKATYRHGIGKAGNVKAGQISQLATRPLGAQAVINPLPASGGADRDSADEARRNAPISVMALDRLISVEDYSAFAQGYAGIGKASAQRLTDGRQQLLHLTITGRDNIPIEPSSDLYRNLLASLQRYGDSSLPIALDVSRTRLLVIAGSVRLLADYAWEVVEPALRRAVLARFGFNQRALAQAAFASEAVEAMQNVEGVAFVQLELFDSVPDDVGAAELATLAQTLSSKPYVTAASASVSKKARSTASASRPAVLPAELVFLSPEVPDTLILKQIRA